MVKLMALSTPSKVAHESKDGCRQYLINAHVPLGWVEGTQRSEGHHVWTNLEGAVVTEYSGLYREVLDPHAESIVAEVYGHINKADVRLMKSKGRKKHVRKQENKLVKKAEKRWKSHKPDKFWTTKEGFKVDET